MFFSLLTCMLQGNSVAIFRSQMANRSERERTTPNLMRRVEKKFFAFMQKMLQWEPSKRFSAKALAEDEWIQENNRY